MTFNKEASFDESICIMKNGAKETTEKEQNKAMYSSIEFLSLANKRYIYSKYGAFFIKERSLYIWYTAQAQINKYIKNQNRRKKQVSNLRLKMTLAPVIGGSERQGFGKYSLCSGKKRTRYRGLQKVSMMERDRKYMTLHSSWTISHSNQHHQERSSESNQCNQQTSLIERCGWI